MTARFFLYYNNNIVNFIPAIIHFKNEKNFNSSVAQ